ncbi:hypothetical protein [Roseibium sp. SCP14]|uniref:hypothetical protein n=1 Tax=Roseibium sp. SCP14 TaxID=3141375 RepID=UPI0033389E1C
MRKASFSIVAVTLLLTSSASAQVFGSSEYDWCKRAEVQTAGFVTPYMTAALLNVPVPNVLDEGIAIVPYEVSIGAGETVSDKLLAFGFSADKINLGLVAELNPEILDLNDLETGATVVLPRFEALAEDNNAVDAKINPVDGFRAASRYVGIVQHDAIADITATLSSGVALTSSVSGQLLSASKDASQVGYFGTQDTIDRMAAVNLGIFDFDRGWSKAAVQPAGLDMLGTPPADDFSRTYAQGLNDYVPSTRKQLISVTVRTFLDGVAVDQLEIRYRNKMLDTLGCPPEFSRRFQKPSHVAHHMLSSANWVIWAVDRKTGRRSAPMDLDLTSVFGFEHPETFDITWVDE